MFLSIIVNTISFENIKIEEKLNESSSLNKIDFIRKFVLLFTKISLQKFSYCIWGFLLMTKNVRLNGSGEVTVHNFEKLYTIQDHHLHWGGIH